MEKQTPGDIIKDGLSDHEGLAPTPAPEMVTPVYFQSANLLADLAHGLSKFDDERHFRNLAGRIQKAYVTKYVDLTTGKSGTGSQANQAFALHTKLTPNSQAVFGHLFKDIESKNDHLSTGILGTKFMLEALSKQGRSDLAYKIATQPDFPGWGWMLKNGATTLWEHWALSENTFSHNHPMFGSVCQWMINWLGGIQPAPDAVGFDKIMIQPQPVNGLDWVKSSYMGIRGKVVSNWRRSKESISYEVEIPVNTTAEISLGAKSLKDVSESGIPLAKALGISNVRMVGSVVRATLRSGNYRLKVATIP